MKRVLYIGVLLMLINGLVACGVEKSMEQPEEPLKEPPKDPEVTVEEPNRPTDDVEESVIEFPLLLKVGEEIGIDLDEDGMAERVLIEVVEDELGWHRYKLTINGADQTDTLELYSENPDLNYYAITDIDSGDARLEIALAYEGPSHDPSTTFLRYENGGLSSLGEVYGMVTEDHLTFPGDGLISSFMRLSVLQTWYAPVQWGIGEDGLLTDVPQELYAPFEDSVAPTKTAKKELAGYADRENRDLRVCVEAGTEFALTATDNVCWVQCKAVNGEEFWLHLNEEDGHRVELFDGSYVWDGIEGLNFAD